ncbi:MAG: energy transducer TonB [Flavobacteriales bacterium]
MRWFCLPLLCLPLLASAQDTPADSTETVHLAIVEEAVRVVKTFPRFSPGLQRGKPVRVSYSLPMNFSLN